MRRVLLFLLAISIVWIALVQRAPASAKSYIEISPASGPPGTLVQIHGFGFPSGSQVRIGMLAPGVLSSAPRDTYGVLISTFPEDKFAPLTTVIPRNVEFSADIRLSPEQLTAHQFGGKVEIIAVVEQPERPNERYFVARTTFSIAAPALAAAGSHTLRSSLPGGWLSASLGVAGALLFAIGWRQRAR